MAFTTYYTPICRETKKAKDGLGRFVYPKFTVDGSTSKDRDEAIRLARQHVDFRDGQAEIFYIHTSEDWEDE